MDKIVLVIVAHPDDEVLGCGGTMFRLVDEGALIVVAIMTSGASSRFQDACTEEKDQQNQLNESVQKAMEYIGVAEVERFNFPDNKMDTIPLLDIIKTIETLVDKYKPETIFTHHSGDLNIDHRITSNAVITATRPVGSVVKNIYGFEVPSSTEWNFGETNPFIPNHFICIDKYIGKKNQAMAFYETENRGFPHPRSSKAIESLANWRGATSGLRSAEAFTVLRQIVPASV